MINIYTFADKRPDFIQLQFESLKKFISNNFEYHVFNNASNPNLESQINSICQQLKIKVL